MTTRPPAAAAAFRRVRKMRRPELLMYVISEQSSRRVSPAWSSNGWISRVTSAAAGVSSRPTRRAVIVPSDSVMNTSMVIVFLS